MKRYSILFLILILSQNIFGQTKMRSDTSVIIDLIESWNLGFSDDGLEPSDIRTFNKFKSLFWPEATIQDDINAVYSPSPFDEKEPYKTSTKSVEDYAHDLALDFKSLKIAPVSQVKYDTDSFYSGSIIRVSLEKKISGEKFRQYVFEDVQALTDSLISFKEKKYGVESVDRDHVLAAVKERINDPRNFTYNFESTYKLLIRLEKRNNTLRIISISNQEAIEKIRCTNDYNDNDAVIDTEDVCKGERGDLTASGCADDDLDGIPNKEDACDFIYGIIANHGCPADYFFSKTEFSIFGGLQTNSAMLNMPNLDKVGYNSIDFNESTKGSLKNPSMIISPVFGVDWAYFFGKRKKNIGVSLGVTYTTFSATYEVDDSAVYTFRSNDGADDYRRRITLHTGSSEKIKYGITNVPLLLRYRHMLGENNKWNFELGVGPSFILFNNTSNYKSKLSFEGMYQVDTTYHDAFTYYDYFDHGSSWNVLLTADAINAQSGSPGAAYEFHVLQAAGYDFVADTIYSGEEKVSRSSIALNAKFDASCRLGNNDRATFKFGVNALIAPLPDQSNGYTLIDKTTDPYNSIYKSKTNSMYFAFGVNVGFVLRW